MNQDVHSAYKDSQRKSVTNREAEAQALLNCADRLEAVKDQECSRAELGNAVKLNQKLWTIFQVSLCEPGNPLPTDLRVLLLNLSRYIDKTSLRILSTDNKDLLRSLIHINRTIAIGLARKPEEQGNPAPGPLQNTAEQPPLTSLSTMA